MSLVLILVCLLVGLLIGSVGIGGVLLVPALTYLADIPVHRAIPACMLSYLATGAIGVLVYSRHGSIRWAAVGWLCVGAVPASLLGALSLLAIPADAVMGLIVVLMVLAGIDALSRRERRMASPFAGIATAAPAYVLIGALTGYGSAITGTGGPLILVPMALYLGVPVLTAVGLSQAIQIPVALSATMGNWIEGNLDLRLGAMIGVLLVAGALIGGTLVHRLPLELVRKSIAWLLLVAGLAIGLRLLASAV
jgi:uncharacterized membrane protein YfcA